MSRFGYPEAATLTTYSIRYQYNATETSFRKLIAQFESHVAQWEKAISYKPTKKDMSFSQFVESVVQTINSNEEFGFYKCRYVWGKQTIRDGHNASPLVELLTQFALVRTPVGLKTDTSKIVLYVHIHIPQVYVPESLLPYFTEQKQVYPFIVQRYTTCACPFDIDGLLSFCHDWESTCWSYTTYDEMKCIIDLQKKVTYPALADTESKRAAALSYLFFNTMYIQDYFTPCDQPGYVSYDFGSRLSITENEFTVFLNPTVDACPSLMQLSTEGNGMTPNGIPMVSYLMYRIPVIVRPQDHLVIQRSFSAITVSRDTQGTPVICFTRKISAPGPCNTTRIMHLI